MVRAIKKHANALSRKEGLSEAYRLLNQSGKPGREGFSCSGVQVIGGDPYACKGYRLPMEAVWEYAARAGTKTAYYNGDHVSKLGQIAWFDKSWEKGSRSPVGKLAKVLWYRTILNKGSTHPVAQKKANLWKLYDMSGNVWEWCWDWFGNFNKLSPINDPTGSSLSSNRVYRGGSWFSSPSRIRLAYRNSTEPSYRFHARGFRLFRSVP